MKDFLVFILIVFTAVFGLGALHLILNDIIGSPILALALATLACIVALWIMPSAWARIQSSRFEVRAARRETELAKESQERRATSEAVYIAFQAKKGEQEALLLSALEKAVTSVTPVGYGLPCELKALPIRCCARMFALRRNEDYTPALRDALVEAVKGFLKAIPPELAFVPQKLSDKLSFVSVRTLSFVRKNERTEKWEWSEAWAKQAFESLAAPLKENNTSKAFIPTQWPDHFILEEMRKEEIKASEEEILLVGEQRDQAIWMTAVAGTPFYRAVGRPKDIQVHVFISISDETRFRHQWVVGDTGAGKTTFLSTMIADDLKRVERNEASLFIMDSQHEWLDDIARLAQFAPGGPLFGKLIYLEPDPDHPLALNIFDLNLKRMAALSSSDRMMLERSAQWMVEFFLKSLVKAEASPHQDTFLKFVIQAVMAIPDATIFTFKELLEPPAKKDAEPPGYAKYKQHFTSLRPDTQKWLAERMHSTELSATRSAIRARLDGFTADSFFHDMFVNPRNKLDLFQELQESRVILVNTKKGLLRSGTEPFGRFFIARLVQAMEERSLLARGARLPVFAYIDEASDYIAEEENIEELIDKARKQRMGLIIANQRESQITSPTVRDALSRAAIQCRGQSQGEGKAPLWTISLNGKEPVEVQVPNTQFSQMPRMSDIEYEGMMLEMRRTYYASGPEAAFEEPPPRQTRNEDVVDAEFREVQKTVYLPGPKAGDSDDHTGWGKR